MTLPLLAPIVLIAVTFRLIDAAKLFDIIYSLTRGGPGTDTYTSSYYLYQQGFELFHLGQGTAGSDVHGDAHVHLLLARATAAEAGGGLAVAVEAARAGRRGRGATRVVRGSPFGSAPSRARSSSCSISASCSCRSTGPR